MKCTRSRAPPLNAPCGTRLLTSPGVAGGKVEVGAVNRQDRPRVGLQRYVDLVDPRMGSIAVGMQVDLPVRRQPASIALGKTGSVKP